jgi:hypothetical protein
LFRKRTHPELPLRELFLELGFEKMALNKAAGIGKVHPEP